MDGVINKWGLAARVEKGRHVVVLRGVSGAGKSTVASFLSNALEGQVTTVSADYYFTSLDVTYKFDPTKLGAAHAQCLDQFVSEVVHEEGENHCIIVDNTNTTVAECAPYMALASAYGWRPLLLTIDTPAEVAAARNVHGVAAGVVQTQGWRMADNDNFMPPFWERATFVD